MTDPIDSKDLEDFLKALARFPQEVNRLIRPALRGATEILRGWVAVYPPATQANSPPEPYYERGYGTRPGPPTSEVLGRSWTTEVGGQGPWQGRMGTTASYGPEVQDEDRQAGVHRGRWRTVQGAVKENRRGILGLIQRAVRQALALVRG